MSSFGMMMAANSASQGVGSLMSVIPAAVTSNLDQDNWEDRFRAQTQWYENYYDPANVRSRYQRAGINPFIVNNGAAFNNGSPISASAEMPSAGQIVTPETMEGVSQSKLTDAITPAEKSLKEAQSKKEFAQACNVEEDTRYKKVMTAYQQVLNSDVLPAQVRELVSRTRKQFAEAGLANADTRLKIAQKVLTELEQEYRKTQNEEVRQRILLLHKEIENYDANSEAQRAALKSQAGLQFSQQMGQDLANDFSVQTLSARVDAELAECSSREEQAKLAKSRLESLESLRKTAVGRWFDNSIEYVCNHLRGIIGGTAVVPLRGKSSAPITPVPKPTE